VIAPRAMLRALGAVLVLLAVPLAAPARAEIADRIVATIDGDPVTALEVRRWGRERGLDSAPEARVLELLITEKLLQKEIKAQGITAREDEIDRYIEEIQARNGVDKEHFAKILADQGMTYDAYRAKVKNEIEKAQLVNREIRQRVNVSPEEIRRWYDAHPDDYAIAERIRVRDIFFAIDDGGGDDEVTRTRQKALEVRELALSGRDFEALARQFSEGPGADKGGELGTFKRGEMAPELEAVAFKLEPKKVSEPILAGGGFHLLRVEERIAAGRRPLEEVKDDIRESLYNDALEERFQNWLSRDLRERHHVEVLD
jgi:peptidyl-prolyl cis-trans isomerase SurA